MAACSRGLNPEPRFHFASSLPLFDFSADRERAAVRCRKCNLAGFKNVCHHEHSEFQSHTSTAVTAFCGRTILLMKAHGKELALEGRITTDCRSCRSPDRAVERARAGDSDRDSRRSQRDTRTPGVA